MKIAFIGQKGIPSISGGVEKHVEDLGMKLVERGHQVLAYTRPNYTPKGMTEFQGVELRSLPSLGTKHLDAISHTLFASIDVMFQKVDIIHFHSIGPSLLVWFVRLLRPRTPVISTFHTQCYHHKKWGVMARLVLRAGEYSLCRFSSRVITVSMGLKRYADAAYGINSVYVPNGTCEASLRKVNVIYDAWGLNRGSYILSIGRLVRHKGLHHLIKAYLGIKTDKKLVIVGASSHTDDYVKDLKSLAHGNDNIIFTGEQTGRVKEELLSNAYAFVQPSESEGLSIALLEAMAYGLPVVVSDIPENLEAVGPVGIRFRDKDHHDLREKLEKLIKNPEKAKDFGESGVDHVAENYNWDKIVKTIEDLYSDSIKINKPKALPKKLLMALK